MCSAAAVVATLLACASAQPPPGGPDDKEPPALLSIAPDSNAVNVRPRAVVFLFDEVIDDRGRGGAALPDLVLISPRDGAPEVDWRRRAVAVRPRRGWRTNTPYTVTLLPGLADRRGNVRKERTTIVFSTGPTIPRTRLRGLIFDWVTGRLAPAALIEAVAPPDTTTVYVTQADSGGRFELSHLPPGHYRVRGTIDLNNNRASDPREPFDTATIALVDSAALELLAFVHDSTAPRISEVSPRDSVTLRLLFDRPLATDWPVEAARFTLRRRDSVSIPVVEAVPAAEFDRRTATLVANRSPSPLARDTVRRPAVPLPPVATPDSEKRRLLVPSRPVPTREIVLTTGAPLMPQSTYRIEVREARGLIGPARTSSRAFSTPKAPAPPGPLPKSPTADSAGSRLPPARRSGALGPVTPSRAAS
ncbi:MAG: hypothetical protein NVS4B3_12520 [Gemmatimonadaceae bacterium]